MHLSRQDITTTFLEAINTKVSVAVHFQTLNTQIRVGICFDKCFCDRVLRVEKEKEICPTRLLPQPALENGTARVHVRTQ
jgi:hypothetical protein